MPVTLYLRNEDILDFLFKKSIYTPSTSFVFHFVPALFSYVHVLPLHSAYHMTANFYDKFSVFIRFLLFLLANSSLIAYC